MGTAAVQQPLLPGHVHRSLPGRKQPPEVPEAWRPAAPQRSGGLPAPMLPSTELSSTAGFTAQWKLPMAELKTCVKEVATQKRVAVTTRQGARLLHILCQLPCHWCDSCNPQPEPCVPCACGAKLCPPSCTGRGYGAHGHKLGGTWRQLVLAVGGSP